MGQNSNLTLHISCIYLTDNFAISDLNFLKSKPVLCHFSCIQSTELWGGGAVTQFDWCPYKNRKFGH